jgi:23S rRNA pseudouridine1911/1915/1917 synthase
VTSLTVPSEDDGQRLDVWLAGQVGISRSQAAHRIDAGAVTVDDVVAARRRRVRTGERVRLQPATAAPASEPPPLPPVRYRDEHLLVIAKPPGLVVHPGPVIPTGPWSTRSGLRASRSRSATTRPAPASCTGSTATPRGCC